MSGTLRIEPAQLEALKAHLFQGRKEEAAFLILQPDLNGWPDLIVKDVLTVAPKDLEMQSPYNIVVCDDAVASMIKAAWDKGMTLAEVHSHRGDWPAQFSPSDVSGLRDFAPHVVWRLKRPYLALVMTMRDYDALIWKTGRAPEALDAMVVGSTSFIPTGISIEGWY